MVNENENTQESQQTQQQPPEPDRDATPPDIELVLNSAKPDKNKLAKLITERKKVK